MNQSCPKPSWLKLTIAVVVGFASFMLDIPINIMSEPFQVSLIFGSVLTMVLAMAWGWQVGLVAATIGLAAMFPLSIWPANGWANVASAVLLCGWFSLHGWAAAKRQAGQTAWWWNPYLVELAFELVYALYILTLFRWSFALNPAPWAPTAETTMPLQVAWIIACKTPVNGLLVVLVADAVLHLAPIRRILHLPIKEEQRYDGLIITLGITVGLALWVVDALVASLVIKGGVSWSDVMAPDPRLVLSRLLLAMCGLIGGLVVADFIRRRLRSERELRDSTIHRQQILETTMDGFWLADREGRILEVNQAYVHMSGFSEAELLTMCITDLDVAESPQQTVAHMHRVQERGEDRFETRHRRKDGSEYDVEVSTLYRADSGGRFFCFLRDISERKQAIRTIELERTLYKDLVAAMPAGVYRCRVIYSRPLQEDAWDQRVELNLVSDAFCQILGVTRAECEADAAIVVSRIHPDDQAEFARLNIIGQKSLAPFNWEGRIIRDGAIRWVRFVSQPRRLDHDDHGDVMWTGVLFDTTDLKIAAAEQQRLEEQLRQREKMDAIGQLAGGIAHDFNNQLTGVLGLAELLERRVPDPRHQQYAAQIRTSARRAADLTQQLLAFARKGKYRDVPTDIHAVIVEVAEIMRRGIDKRIVITLRLEATASIVQGDPSQLQNVLLNLGLNARDAMPNGGELVIATHIEVRTDKNDLNESQPNRCLVITVQDSGMGMNEETKRRLFEPFFTTKAVGKGTGLGLASAYGVVKGHGGTIQVSSELGHGSTFTIHLPMSETTPKISEDPQRIERHIGKGLILVVDDEPTVCAVVGDMLTEIGYQVHTCTNPAEAIEWYRNQWREVSLVVLDMMMPVMSGKDVFLALREINPQIRAILSSGYSLSGEAQAILDAGVKGFVQKPFDYAVLEQAVAKVMAG